MVAPHARFDHTAARIAARSTHPRTGGVQQNTTKGDTTPRTSCAQIYPHSQHGQTPETVNTSRVIHKNPGTIMLDLLPGRVTRLHLGVSSTYQSARGHIEPRSDRFHCRILRQEPQAAGRRKHATGTTGADQNRPRRPVSIRKERRPAEPEGNPRSPGEIVQPRPSYAVSSRDRTAKSATSTDRRSSTVIPDSLATHRACFRRIR